MGKGKVRTVSKGWRTDVWQDPTECPQTRLIPVHCRVRSSSQEERGHGSFQTELTSGPSPARWTVFSPSPARWTVFSPSPHRIPPEHHVRWNKGANTFRPRWEELSLDSWLFGQGGRQTLTANPTPVGTSTSMSRMFIWDIPKWGTGSPPTPQSIRARAPASTPSTVL